MARDRSDKQARLYIDRGWNPIPVKDRSKKPTANDWQNLRVNEGNVSKYFDIPNLNVGILLGEPSQWLVDVDLDVPEARLLAPKILPPTPVKFGRHSSPASHWLYYAKGAKTLALKHGDKVTVELRSTGRQTVFPGSVHESGEVVRWEPDASGEPATVTADEIERACQLLAQAVKMAREGWAEDTVVSIVKEGWGDDRPPRETRQSDTSFADAVRQYNADHRRDIPRSGGDCPGCGHRDCFGRTPGDPNRWYCFSSSHSSPGIKGSQGYHGDFLDLDAHEMSVSRYELLKLRGYLTPKKNETKTEAAQTQETSSRLLSMSDLLLAWEKAPDKRYLPTGISVIDRPLGGGLPVGFTTMILAGTNVGKSEFARQVGRSVALNGHHVLHLDGELSESVMADRWVSQEAQVAAAILAKRSEWTDSQIDSVESAKRKIASLPIRTAFLDPIPTDELEALIITALKDMPGDKPHLVIVDSVHHFSYGYDAKDRRMQVDGFVRWVNKVARATGAAFLLIAEQKRQAPGEAPLGAESRSLEFQAHVSLALEEVEAAADQTADDASSYNERRVKVTVVKNRVGRKGRVQDELVFVHPCWDMKTAEAEDERLDQILEHMASHGEWKYQREIEKALRVRNGSLKKPLSTLVDTGRMESATISGTWAGKKYRIAVSPRVGDFSGVPGTRGQLGTARS